MPSLTDPTPEELRGAGMSAGMAGSPGSLHPSEPPTQPRGWSEKLLKVTLMTQST